MVYPELPTGNKQENKSKSFKKYKINKRPSNKKVSYTNETWRYGNSTGNRNFYNPNHYTTWIRPSYQRGHSSKRKSFQRLQKPPTRPPSPTLGSEEYTLRKIQQTSESIMKQLLNPPLVAEYAAQEPTEAMPVNEQVISEGKAIQRKNKIHNKKISSIKIEEIHSKIVSHIIKLNDGRKKNLINSTSSGYDVAIQQIQKQRRLEISRALRDIGSTGGMETSDYLNSIIPDIGIKLEDLPADLIEELRNTLDFDFDLPNSHDNDEITADPSEVINQCDTENRDFLIPKNIKEELINIKIEPLDIKDDDEDNIQIEPLHDSKLQELLVDPCTMQEEIKNELEMIVDNNNPASNPSTLVEVELKNPAIKLEELKENQQIDLDANVFDKGKGKCTPDKSDNKEIKREEMQNTASVCTQTDTADCSSELQKIIDLYLNSCSNKSPSSISEAVTIMLNIDGAISKLTDYRKDIFLKYQCEKMPPKPVSVSGNKTISVKNDQLMDTKNQVSNIDDFLCELEPKNINNISEKVLIVKTFSNTILAATESGKLYFFSISNGNFMHKLNVSNVAITALVFCKNKGAYLLFVTSLDSKMQIYDLNNRSLLKVLKISEGLIVECMDLGWSCNYMGCKDGTLLRYSIDMEKIVFNQKISDSTVFVLKTTNEGARKVILVGTCNSPVCVRDATSGLYMRTMDYSISPTVQSLLLNQSFVYCGTTNHNILIYSFQDGALLHKLNAPNSKGIGCMQIVDNILYASCHTESIYVYCTKNNILIGLLPGPGGVILAMAVLKTQILVSTMSSLFEFVEIPSRILHYNKHKPLENSR